ncbi:hypothetical protein Q5752_005211 [Cryptotrichosporon argae]
MSAVVIHDDCSYAQGDVVLISSDHVAFRVEGCRLQTHSRWFARTMTQPGCWRGGHQFHDPATETSDVIRRFLGMISNAGRTLRHYGDCAFKEGVGADKGGGDEADARVVRDVIVFAKRYECFDVLGQLEAELYIGILGREPKPVMRCTLDSAELEPEIVAALPLHYFGALNRTWYLHAGKRLDKPGFGRECARRFKRLMADTAK